MVQASVIYSTRPAADEDYEWLSTYPQSAEELFYLFPTAAYPLTADQLRAKARKRLHPTVLTAGAEPVGYSNLYDPEDGACWLGNVILAPAVRGTGAGGVLIGRMMQIARDELGMSKLKLICHNRNARAMVFYHKLGFRPYDLKRLRDQEERDIAGIMMEIELSGGGASE